MGRRRLLDRGQVRCNRLFTLLTFVGAIAYIGIVTRLSALRDVRKESSSQNRGALAQIIAQQEFEKVASESPIDLPNNNDRGGGLHPFEPGCDVHPPLKGTTRIFQFSAGSEDLRPKSLAIIGIARNIGRRKIEAARQGFQSLGASVFQGRYQVFFVENDSNDCTGTVLKEWERDDPNRVHVVSEQLNQAAPKTGDHMKRIQLIASYRNKVLHMMKAHNWWPFDYVLAVDLDMTEWQAETLATAFQQSNPWDMVCANGVMSEFDPRYYDAFAFRSEEFPKGPLEERRYFGLNGYVSQIHNGLIRDKADPMVPVHSCFGGMAIYRGRLFEDCEYSSDDGDCEHVHLHHCMRRKRPHAKFFMLPSMRLVYDLDRGELEGYNVKTS